MTAGARPPSDLPKVDDIRLGIVYMVASVFLFSFQNAIGKWLAELSDPDAGVLPPPCSIG